MRVFGLTDILETDNKGKVSGSYRCTELIKSELSLEKNSTDRRPCKFHLGKVFIGDGNSIIQYNMAKLKVDTTFALGQPVTAIDAKDQDVSFFSQ